MNSNIYRVTLLIGDEGYRVDTFCAECREHAEYLASIAHKRKDFVILDVAEL
jgi:hypothetical protein